MKPIVQVVRSFGPTGGMEEIVWQLTRALVDQGESVQVLCEKDASNGLLPVRVTELGRSTCRRRWRKHVDFSRRVNDWAVAHGPRDALWHSHEMLTRSDVCTFHSTPHGVGAERDWWRRLDPGWHANQWLERRSLLGAQRVVPLSALLERQLEDRHSYMEERLMRAIPPGVQSVESRSLIKEPVIGFMGWEWKRKGLDRVVAICRALPETRLVIAGPSQADLGDMLEGLDRVEVLGMVDRDEFFQRIRLLVHPARLEAFGMVVTESMARSIPVLVSNATGAASEVGTAHGRVLPLDAPMEEWTAVAAELLKQDGSTEPYRRSWTEVADAYRTLYAQLVP